ncbi:MAG: hypothetical protein RID91_16105 [Azospirillaceae bacterium]
MPDEHELHGFGSFEEIRQFALFFVDHYFNRFCRDVRICLRDDPLTGKHAYMPALVTIVAHWELAAGMMTGKLGEVDRVRTRDMADFGRRFVPCFETRYPDGALYYIYKAYRHKIAHSGHPYIPTEVRKPGDSGEVLHLGFEFTEVEEDVPVKWVAIEPDRSKPLHHPLPPWGDQLKKDWTLHVSLPPFARDVFAGVNDLRRAMDHDTALTSCFAKAMTYFYPKHPSAAGEAEATAGRPVAPPNSPVSSTAS